MNQYANRLIDFFINENSLNIDAFLPKVNFISKFLGQNFGMRYARYFSYPYQAKKKSFSEVAHVCDHQYGHLLNYLKCKVKIITVHDLIPIIFEKEKNKNPVLLKYSLSKLKFFDKIIAISDNTKKDILKYTDCPEEKIEVIYQSVERYFNINKINKKEICQKYKIPFEKKKILISGNVFYKNNKISYEVLEELIKKDDNIILIHIGGKENYLYSKKLIKDKHYFVLSDLDYKEMPNIYKISDIFFPSIYEGYGLPIVEAMKCGLPVICSNNSSIPEIIDDAGLTCNHDNIKYFTHNIFEILNDEEKKSFYIKKSIARSKHFDLEKHNKNILDIYKNELDKKNL